MARMGFRTVWDIRKPSDKKGETEEEKRKKAIDGFVDNAIAVDGCLYLKWMPDNLIYATFDLRREDSDPKKTDEATYYARMKSRTAYRVMCKGRPEADGTFRFYYPTIDTKKHRYYDPPPPPATR